MALRASKLDFGRSPFTAADMAHANYLYRNPRTLITGDGEGGFNPLAPVPTESIRRGVGDAAKDIVRAIDDWYAAKREDDKNSMVEAARSLVGATIAHQREQGGREQARELLPPAFVEAEANEIRRAPPQQQPAMIRSLIESFEDDVKPDVLRQVAKHISISSPNFPSGEGVVREVPGPGTWDKRPPAYHDHLLRDPEPLRPRTQIAYDGDKADGRFQVAGGYGGGRTPAPPIFEPPADWQSRPAPKPPSRPGCVAKGDMVTCQPPHGLPPVSFPRPPDWSDDYFDETRWDYHDYRVVQEDDYVPPQGKEKEYEDRLFEELVNDPTPGADKPATRHGQRNDVGSLGPLGVLYGPNYVRSYIIERDGRKFVVNVTDGDHWLSPGYVIRTVVRLPNGRYAIVTVGSGVDFKQANSHKLGRYANTTGVQEPWRSNSKDIFRRARSRR